MTIEFIQEDGTSKTDSTSYASIVQFKQYWENRGTDYSALTDVVIQGRLNASTEYIDLQYNFFGYKSDEDQSLEWPRYNVPKDKRFFYDSDEMCRRIWMNIT